MKSDSASPQSQTINHRQQTTGQRPPATDHRHQPPESSIIQIHNLTLAYGSTVIMRDLTFDVHKGEVLIIMGGSGSGKSTLLKSLIGLFRPAAGKILYGATDYWTAGQAEQNRIRRRMGVLYQHGALWSSMTLAENIALPIEVYTGLKQAQVKDLVSFKLSLVGLAGHENAYPAELSGGMRKRAALARAMALDPEILFFDEPSSGLDPVSARRLDELILELQSSLGTTMIVVTHDLDSIFTIGTRAIFLDASQKTMAAIGDPREMRDTSDNPTVREFLNRGKGKERAQRSP
ncbi:MAG: ATP-binding cassette domain-containing protein [Desulfovermiculus sp.]|nr:ATP-binding cassette domain-containing protein [Desulfovermiculus sp.]